MSKILKINNKVVGEFYQEIDGFYRFVPSKGEGYWDEHILMIVLYKLRVLNAAWDLQIMTDPKISNLGEDKDEVISM